MTRILGGVAGAGLAALALVLVAGCSATSSATNPTPTPDPVSTSASASASASAPASRTTPSAVASTPKALTTLHPVAESWTLPYAISRVAAVSTGADTVVLAGGMPPDNSSTDRVIQVNLATGAITTQPRLAVKVHDAAAGSAGGPTVYGGGNSTEQKVVQRFVGGRWTLATPLSGTRSDLTVIPTSSGDLVIGGYDGTHAVTDIALATASGVTAHGHLVKPVRYAAGAVIGQTAYVVGGEVDGVELDVIQCVDVTTGASRICGHLPAGLGHAQVVAVDGRLLIAGGRTAPHALTAKMSWWDPATATLTPAGTLPTPLADAAVAVSGSGASRVVHLLGGQNPSVTDAVVAIPLTAS